MASKFLLYGATGYTGELIARRAVKRGLHPILAGRNAEKVAALANELALEHRVFALDDPAALDKGLAGIAVVLHCAGPFAHTSKPMVDACLRTKTHYLDITGEIAVFESLARRTAEAYSAGLMLLPGVGSDVVPTDCLAAHLKRRMPTAKKLTLAYMSTTGFSHGTATTAVENIHRGGAVRSGGKITRVPAAWKTRKFDFGRGPVLSVLIPWGDVSTAFYSTGIPNIEFYSPSLASARPLMIASRYLGWLLGSSPVQKLLKRQIQSQPPGPNDAEREHGKSIAVGEVEDAAGNKMLSRLRGPESYKITVLTAIAIVQKVLDGKFTPAFQTPSLAYGADFILEIEGVTREDLD